MIVTRKISIIFILTIVTEAIYCYSYRNLSLESAITVRSTQQRSAEFRVASVEKERKKNLDVIHQMQVHAGEGDIFYCWLSRLTRQFFLGEYFGVGETWVGRSQRGFPGGTVHRRRRRNQS